MEESGAASMLHSILEPLGVHANHIDLVWDTMMWVCGVMYAIVLIFLTIALLRHRRSQSATDNAEATHQRLSIALAVWTVLVVLGLFGLTLTSFFTDRALVRAASEPQVLLKLTATQWWWDIEYLHSDPSQRFRTANEIHLPVDAQVLIELTSNDVIHSQIVTNTIYARCPVQSEAFVIGMGIVWGLVAVIGAFLSWRTRQALPQEDTADASLRTDRFVATLSMIFAAFCALFIIFATPAGLILRCEQ